MKTGVREKIVAILLFLLFTVSLFVAPICGVFAIPKQFNLSYYGELSKMYERLYSAKGKKLVLVGGSALAFGTDVALLQSQIDGYTVCPFGLYGAIGTKTMMDLSMDALSSGDIVVLAPEISAQTMSLYFSPIEVWRGMDGKFSMFSSLRTENKGAMLAALPSFSAEKYKYYTTQKPSGSGVYAATSFDENCSMTFPRPYNTMSLLYDEIFKVDYSEDLITGAFCDYVNEYYRFCVKKGVRCFYGFSPVNALAVSDNATPKEFYQKLNDHLNCPLMGAIEDYIFDHEWFYDSNFHMNTSGMTVYTVQLINDLKVMLGDGSETKVEMPQKPMISQTPTQDNLGDSDCFIYEALQSGYRIIGLSDLGLEKTKLTVPSLYNGKPVYSFSVDTFMGQKKLIEVIIPASVTNIADRSFDGCTSLSVIRLQSAVPNCSVGFHLLDGTEGVKIEVADQQAYLAYVVDYYWQNYTTQLYYPQG